MKKAPFITRRKITTLSGRYNSFVISRDVNPTVIPNFNAQRRKSKPLEPVMSDAKATSEFVEIAQVFKKLLLNFLAVDGTEYF